MASTNDSAHLDPSQSSPAPEQSGTPGTAVVLRDVDPDARTTPARRASLPRGVAALRTRLPELARNPVVVTTATLMTGLALQVAKEALLRSAAPARRRGAEPVNLNVSGYVVHRVDVVHHVIHHVVQHGGGSAAPRQITR